MALTGPTSDGRQDGWLVFERAYSLAIRPQRLWLAEMRGRLAACAHDQAAERSLVLELADAHRAACRAAFASTQAEVGTAWLTSLGVALPDHLDRLWTEYGEPLTGITADRLWDVRGQQAV